MKNLFFFIPIIFWSNTLSAQDIPSSQVPNEVKTAFLRVEANPKDVEWEKKGQYYEVEYEIGRFDHELWISPTGQILRHKEEVSSSNLPQSIKNLLQTQYKEFRVDDVDKLTVGNNVFYKIELENDRGSRKQEIDLVLDENAKPQDASVWYQVSNK